MSRYREKEADLRCVSGVDDRYPPSIVSLEVRCRDLAHVPVEAAGSPV